MPVTKSAIKKQRQDKKREKHNDEMRAELKLAVKKARKSKTTGEIKKASSLLDKAAQNNIIHKNKAARLKSSLAKNGPKPAATAAKKAEKKTSVSKPTSKATKKK